MSGAGSAFRHSLRDWRYGAAQIAALQAATSRAAERCALGGRCAGLAHAARRDAAAVDAARVAFTNETFVLGVIEVVIITLPQRHARATLPITKPGLALCAEHAGLSERRERFEKAGQRSCKPQARYVRTIAVTRLRETARGVLRMEEGPAEAVHVRVVPVFSNEQLGLMKVSTSTTGVLTNTAGKAVFAPSAEQHSNTRSHAARQYRRFSSSVCCLRLPIRVPTGRA